MSDDRLKVFEDHCLELIGSGVPWQEMVFALTTGIKRYSDEHLLDPMPQMPQIERLSNGLNVIVPHPVMDLRKVVSDLDQYAHLAMPANKYAQRMHLMRQKAMADHRRDWKECDRLDAELDALK